RPCQHRGGACGAEIDPQVVAPHAYQLIRPKRVKGHRTVRTDAYVARQSVARAVPRTKRAAGPLVLWTDPPREPRPYPGAMLARLRSLWDEPGPADAPARVWRDWVLVAGFVCAAVLEVLLRPGLPYRWFAGAV